MILFNKSYISIAVLTFVHSYVNAATCQAIYPISAGSNVEEDISVVVNEGVFRPGLADGMTGGVYIQGDSNGKETNVDGNVNIELNGRFYGGNWQYNFSGINSSVVQNAGNYIDVKFNGSVDIVLGVNLDQDRNSDLSGINSFKANYEFNKNVNVNINNLTKIYGSNDVTGVSVNVGSVSFKRLFVHSCG